MKNKNEKIQTAPEQVNVGKEKPQFIDVPVDVAGKYKGKNYVELKGLAYNPESGNLSLHLGDKHTLLFKSNFQKEFLNIVLKTAEKEERAAKSAPTFEKSTAGKSNARMKLMGEGDGRTFVGVTGQVKYNGSFRGLVVNLDDKHVTIVDSQVLSKELGITVNPIAMERNIGLSR